MASRGKRSSASLAALPTELLLHVVNIGELAKLDLRSLRSIGNRRLESFCNTIVFEKITVVWDRLGLERLAYCLNNRLSINGRLGDLVKHISFILKPVYPDLTSSEFREKLLPPGRTYGARYIAEFYEHYLDACRQIRPRQEHKKILMTAIQTFPVLSSLKFISVVKPEDRLYADEAWTTMLAQNVGFYETEKILRLILSWRASVDSSLPQVLTPISSIYLAEVRQTWLGHPQELARNVFPCATPLDIESSTKLYSSITTCSIMVASWESFRACRRQVAQMLQAMPNLIHAHVDCKEDFINSPENALDVAYEDFTCILRKDNTHAQMAKRVMGVIWPRLQTLSLDGFMFVTMDLREFVKAHENTLRHLSLTQVWLVEHKNSTCGADRALIHAFKKRVEAIPEGDINALLDIQAEAPHTWLSFLWFLRGQKELKLISFNIRRNTARSVLLTPDAFFAADHVFLPYWAKQWMILNGNPGVLNQRGPGRKSDHFIDDIERMVSSGQELRNVLGIEGRILRQFPRLGKRGKYGSTGRKETSQFVFLLEGDVYANPLYTEALKRKNGADLVDILRTCYLPTSWKVFLDSYVS